MLYGFYIISKILLIYSFMCFIRIIFTWFPKVNYSKPGTILAAVCDPYLNLFKKLGFLTYRNLDFSAALALCSLFAASTIFESLSTGQPLSFGVLLAILLQLTWAFVSSVVKFIIVLLIIRLVVFIFMQKSANGNYGTYNPMWDQIDRFISPLIFGISSRIFRHMVSFTKALATTIVIGFVSILILDKIAGLCCYLLANLPF